MGVALKNETYTKDEWSKCALPIRDSHNIQMSDHVHSLSLKKLALAIVRTT